jgi:hypothetical protein
MKIAYSNYDPETDISTVTIHNQYGKFTGTASRHPEDKPSRFEGCRYAELRAIKKYYKERSKIAFFQIKNLKSILKQLQHNPNANLQSEEVHQIKIAIRNKTEERVRFNKIALSIDDTIKKEIALTEQVKKKLNK